MTQFQKLHLAIDQNDQRSQQRIIKKLKNKSYNVRNFVSDQMIRISVKKNWTKSFTIKALGQPTINQEVTNSSLFLKNL